MVLTAEQLGKRFHHEWVIRGFNYRFEQGKAYALTGFNGSGKSTLLQLLAGYQIPTEGQTRFSPLGQNQEQRYRYLAIAAPYLELPEELNLEEALRLHFRFKGPAGGQSHRQLARQMRLENALHKPLQQYSSGMLQRVRLGLALFSDVPLLFLDEPASNLDSANLQWYLEQTQPLMPGRITFIASNDPREYPFADEVLGHELWQS